MKHLIKILVFNLFTVILLSCGGISQYEYQQIKTQNDALKQEVEELKKEINELKFGADNLLTQAKSYMDKQAYNDAKNSLTMLIEKYPTSAQEKEARQLLDLAEKGISELNKAEKERLANATKKMRKQFDDVKGITWYYDNSTTKYTNSNSLHLYIGQKENEIPWLRFCIQYAANDWLFIESYDIKTDKNTYTINTSYGEVKTDHSGGGIWEWYDVGMDNKLYEIVKDIINSKSVKIRHNGKKYYKDRTVTNNEKQALKNILDAYEALGGNTNF